jgi:hypothetical protein
MEHVTKKAEFKTAYGAGRQAVEKLGRTFYWMLAATIILTRIVVKWFVTRYSLSGLESLLLSVVAVALAVSLLFLFERRSHQSGRGKNV